MKKLVATLSLAALATGAGAQGFVSLANANFPITTVTYGVTNITGTAANSFYYDVLINASTVTTVDPSLQGLAAAGWSDSGVTGINGSGLIGAGKIITMNMVATGWANTFDSAIVVGWSANLGTTWAQAAAAIAGDVFILGQGWSGLANGYVGYSTIAQAIPGVDAGTAAALFSSAPTAQVPTPISTGFSLYGIPEPGTLALAGLGVASLLVFRRRK